MIQNKEHERYDPERIPERFSEWLQNNKTYVVTFLIGIIVVIVFVAIFVIGIVFGAFSSEPRCQDDDGFEKLKTVRFKFAKRANWNTSVEACMNLNAELWEVKGGREEWEDVLDSLKTNHTTKLDQDIWLNGKSNINCDKTYTECESKARDGKGVPVFWASRHNNSSYSRLVTKAGQNSCIKFSSEDDFIWFSTDCNNKYIWALCVKINCEK